MCIKINNLNNTFKQIMTLDGNVNNSLLKLATRNQRCSTSYLVLYLEGLSIRLHTGVCTCFSTLHYQVTDEMVEKAQGARDSAMAAVSDGEVVWE